MALPTLTVQQVINKLTNTGLRWNTTRGTGATITYSFRTSVSRTYGNGTEYVGFQPFTEAQKAAARLALSRWAEVANLTFVEVEGNAGTITFANTSMSPSAAAYAYYPGNYFECSGDVWLNTNVSTNTGALYDMGYGASTLVHELGHALGLSHPDNYNVGTSLVRHYVQDNRLYTVMSYFNTSDYMYSAKPLLYDVAAMQSLYGANMSTRAGDTTYSWANNAYFADCIWDAGGNDLIDASNQSRRVVINLNAGGFSSIGLNRYGAQAVNNLSIAFGAVIESASGGAGNDTLTGNGADNALNGNAGNDSLSGGAGNDSLSGGSGNDILSGGAGNDTYLFSGTWGNDLVTDNSGLISLDDVSGADLTFARYNDGLRITSETGSINIPNYFRFIEGYSLADANGAFVLPQLAALRSATTASDTITCCADDDICDGLAGNDRFVASQGGNDSLSGGAGNDLFQLGLALTSGDTINGGGGFDTLRFVDAGTGTDMLDNVGGIESIVVGNAATHVVTTDSLVAAGAALTFNAGALTGGLKLTFDGSAETDGRFQVFGGTGADSIVGGSGNDTLRGGAGNDTLVAGDGRDILDGGAGNDTLVCGTFLTAADTVTGGAGYDVLTFTATDAVNVLQNVRGVERIVCGDAATTLTVANAVVGPGARMIIDASGLSGQNALTVNAAAETDGFLSVVGGAGDDTVFGGARNDTLQGGAGDDSMAAGAGNDRLEGGTGDDALRGGAGADVLLGEDGADTLVGSAGADVLIGGAGADCFSFTARTDSVYGARDSVRDFTTGLDSIDLTAFHLSTDTSQLGQKAAAASTLVLDYFSVGGADRAVVYAQSGADGVVFVDCNASGNFESGSDLVFRLLNVSGSTAPVITDFAF